MIIAILLGLTLLSTSVIFHYEGLARLSSVVNAMSGSSRAHMLVVMFSVVALHLCEILFYAVAYWFGGSIADIGSFSGTRAIEVSDYLYFSAEAYSTLGLGDIYPRGYLRLIAGLEALNGLILITWSASFTYIAMEKYWDVRNTSRQARPRESAD